MARWPYMYVPTQKNGAECAGIVTTYELRVPPATHHSSVLPVLVDHCEL